MRFWIILGLAYTVLTIVFVLVGAPSPYLFAGVIVGALCSVRVPNPPPLPEQVRNIGLAVLGVAAGAGIGRPVLRTVLDQPAAVLGGVVVTLALSLAVGQLLRLSQNIDATTAVFASIAGGAAGVSAVAKELGADETLVLTIQYLRVLVVLVSVPFVASFLGGAGAAGGPTGAGWDSLPFAAVAVVVGLALARLLSFSASRLILPLVVTTAMALTGVLAPAGVPPGILSFAYATTGVAVGLSFTRARLRQVARIMPLALLQVLLSVAACAAVGVAFARLAGVSTLDGYLATTPGGLPVVIAVAIGSGASVGLIITLQVVRLFLSLLMAPALGAAMMRRVRE
jgi:membrane AbrB-like protein